MTLLNKYNSWCLINSPPLFCFEIFSKNVKVCSYFYHFMVCNAHTMYMLKDVELFSLTKSCWYRFTIVLLLLLLLFLLYYWNLLHITNETNKELKEKNNKHSHFYNNLSFCVHVRTFLCVFAWARVEKLSTPTASEFCETL